MLRQQHGAGGVDGGQWRTADQHVCNRGQLWWLRTPYIRGVYADSVPGYLRRLCLDYDSDNDDYDDSHHNDDDDSSHNDDDDGSDKHDHINHDGHHNDDDDGSHNLNHDRFCDDDGWW